MVCGNPVNSYTHLLCMQCVCFHFRWVFATQWVWAVVWLVLVLDLDTKFIYMTLVNFMLTTEYEWMCGSNGFKFSSHVVHLVNRKYRKKCKHCMAMCVRPCECVYKSTLQTTFWNLCELIWNTSGASLKICN